MKKASAHPNLCKVWLFVAGQTGEGFSAAQEDETINKNGHTLNPASIHTPTILDRHVMSQCVLCGNFMDSSVKHNTY